MTNSIKTTVKYTTRNDGNGQPITGFYIIANGVAIGCPRKTYEAAYADLTIYRRELLAMVTR
jgi:hypothetical protein